MAHNKQIVNSEEGYVTADLFLAARNDDPAMMRQALLEGQSLREVRPEDGRTPTHEAAAFGSVEFLKAALEVEPDIVWVRDLRHRRPYEYAAARNDRISMRLIANTMYPESQKPLPPEQ
ncbi:MAG: hypothetical protein QNI84_14130 [Henriciella sp.]|nr:hypothetical protein [Henriciella sp.]